MPLSKEEFKTCHSALKNAFDIRSLRQMLRMEIGSDIVKKLAWRESLHDITFRLVQIADAEGRIPELLQAARNHSSNEQLVDLCVNRGISPTTETRGEQAPAKTNTPDEKKLPPKAEPAGKESSLVKPDTDHTPAGNPSLPWAISVISVFLAIIGTVVLYKILNPAPVIGKPVILSVKPSISGSGLKWNTEVRFSTRTIPEDKQLKMQVEISEDKTFASVLFQEKPVTWETWRGEKLFIGIPRPNLPGAYARMIVINNRDERLSESEPFYFVAPQE